MNPLTQVKNLQKITARETAAGVSDDGSWHAKYKHSAYIFAGGLPYDLTEGDLLAVFAQYGEIVDMNLIRDKGTGKSKGYAFAAYEDQRSTVLAVDNLNGACVGGRTIRVDHVDNYKRKIEEDEEEEQKKREERGVCYAFQRGECTRGAGCKFSHDEQRNANTGWGPGSGKPRWGRDGAAEPESPKWSHDRYEDSRPPDKFGTAMAKDGDRKRRFDEGTMKGSDERRRHDRGGRGSDERRRRDGDGGWDERRRHNGGGPDERRGFDSGSSDSRRSRYDERRFDDKRSRDGRLRPDSVVNADTDHRPKDSDNGRTRLNGKVSDERRPRGHDNPRSRFDDTRAKGRQERKSGFDDMGSEPDHAKTSKLDNSRLKDVD